MIKQQHIIITLLCTAIVLIISCNSRVGFKERSISLHNQNKSILIDLPIELDTTKTTIIFSDYKCGNLYKQTSINKVFYKSVFDTIPNFRLTAPDTIPSMSFSVMEYLVYDCNMETTPVDEETLNRNANRYLTIYTNASILHKSFINDIAIIGIERQETFKITAHTIHNGNFIALSYQQIKSADKALFYQMIKNIERMKFTDN